MFAMFHMWMYLFKILFFSLFLLQVLEQLRKQMLHLKKLCFSEAFCAREYILPKTSFYLN